MFDLNRIETIFIVVMENRSFDHLLGYRSLAPSARANIDGLRGEQEWLMAAANPYNGRQFAPFRLTDPYDPIDADPPHERHNIAAQMGPLVNGRFAMNGFVANYADAPGAKCLSAEKPPPVMGYFTGAEVPVTDFFADNFAVCDHWFASLPAGTQPNRLMAMSGYSSIDVNVPLPPLPDQALVYDWLNQNGIRWRVYHQGLPFFAMMPRWVGSIFDDDHFRPFKQLSLDVEDSPDEFPQVVFIEPMYTSCPHLGPGTDDHAPSAVKGGQEFLFEVYRDLTRNPDRFATSVTIITYDEHGGFFDHVSPPAIPTDPPPGIRYRAPFTTLGVRVPAFVISPFVRAGDVCNSVLDHTSILKFIGEKFGPGGYYSVLVNERPVASVSEVLSSGASRTAPTIQPLIDYLARAAPATGFTPGAVPQSPMEHAFECALEMVRRHPAAANGKFRELIAAFPERRT